MTDLDLLKQHRPDVPAPDPIVLARARLALQAPPTHRRLTRPRLVVAAALATTLTGAFLISDVVGHHSSPPPGTTATAGTFLATAADLLAANPDKPVPPGQYRHITVTTTATYARRAGNRWFDIRDGSRLELWYPSNERPPFALRHSFRRATVSPADEKLFTGQRTGSTFHRSACLAVLSRGLMITIPIGNQVPTCQHASWSQPTPEFLARQPRDPEALYRSMAELDLPPARRMTKGSDPAAQARAVFARVSSVLMTGIVPSDLRMALYRAARLIPGVVLLDETVVVNGVIGRVVGLDHAGIREDLIIEPTSGRLLGQREVVTDPGSMPANSEMRSVVDARRGQVISESSISTEITATVPRAPSR